MIAEELFDGRAVGVVFGDDDPALGVHLQSEIVECVDALSPQASVDRVLKSLERGIEIPDRKILLESTPTFTGRSRVNRGYVRTA